MIFYNETERTIFGCGTAKEAIMIEAAEIQANSDASPQATSRVKVYQDGTIAGVLGAGTIALWFLIVDSIQGRPFYTPTVLGTALFGGGQGLQHPNRCVLRASLCSSTWR